VLLGADGRPLTSGTITGIILALPIFETYLDMYINFILQVLLGADGRPLTSGTGLSLAMSPEGTPLMGPDGAPLCLAPDDEMLLSWGGLPLLGPQVCVIQVFNISYNGTI
jgi:hypothetical protein